MEEKAKKNKWIINGKTLWIYTKYQIVTKLIFALVTFPIFRYLIDFLVKLSGRTNLTTGDYKGFIFSIYSLPVIILGLLFLIFVLGMDINVFIITSSLIEEKKLNMKIKDVLIAAFKSLKSFLTVPGFFIVIYVAFILPLLSLGISMGFLSKFKIPNFVTSVIFSNTIYNIIYILVMVLLTVISFIYIFTLHFMIVDRKGVIDALKSSRKLVFKNLKHFVIHYLLEVLKTVFLFFMVFLFSVLFLIALCIL